MSRKISVSMLTRLIQKKTARGRKGKGHMTNAMGAAQTQNQAVSNKKFAYDTYTLLTGISRI